MAHEIRFYDYFCVCFLIGVCRWAKFGLKFKFIWSKAVKDTKRIRKKMNQIGLDKVSTGRSSTLFVTNKYSSHLIHKSTLFHQAQLLWNMFSKRKTGERKSDRLVLDKSSWREGRKEAGKEEGREESMKLDSNLHSG